MAKMPTKGIPVGDADTENMTGGNYGDASSNPRGANTNRVQVSTWGRDTYISDGAAPPKVTPELMHDMIGNHNNSSTTPSTPNAVKARSK